MRTFLLLASLAFSAVAFGQTEPPVIEGTMNISWTNPVERCSKELIDGERYCEPIQEGDLAAINLYISEAPITDDYSGAPDIVVSDGAERVTHVHSFNYGDTLYVRAKAVLIDGATSKFSNQAEYRYTLNLIPGEPQNVSFTIEINFPQGN